MKKAAKVFFAIFSLLFVLFITEYKIPVKASPLTWTVNDDASPPANFTKIQDAIDHANSGDIIFVYNGTYSENIVVNQSLTIIGENRDFTIIDGAGANTVVFINANSVTIKDFTIRNSGPYPYGGVHIERYIGNVISNNKIIDNSEGVSVYSSSGNVISDNIISNNGEGITISFSINNVVSGNLVFSNDDSGIYLYSSSGNVISGNTFEDNLGGISAYWASNNVISDNTIVKNREGMTISLSSTKNLIYHNNFDNILKVLIDPDLKNSWDYIGEGNYWSDYTGQDLNEDGIGDSPYVINEDNQDNYPLMGMFSTFKIVLETNTYNVTVVSNSTISDFKFEIGKETGNKIISYDATNVNESIAFFRVMIPIELMANPYFVLVDGGEIIPTLLNISNDRAYLYFTYPVRNSSISIISSRTMQLYYELLTQYSALQESINGLNITFYDLLEDYGILLGNYSSLLENLYALNASYQKHLLDYSVQLENTKSLLYIFAATTAIFMITTVYLSRHAHAKVPTRTKTAKEE